MNESGLNGTVELVPHPSLARPAQHTRFGWDPAQVDVVFKGLRFPTANVVDDLPEVEGLEPPNGRKFGLAKIATVAGHQQLEIELAETDFFTVQRVARGLADAPETRRRFASLDPARSRIPHSFSLHYLVGFADGSVLCVRRSPHVAYHPNHWSFSAEEQLAEADVFSERPLETLFQRAILEEVFPLPPAAGSFDLRWKQISSYVASMRLWSVIVETSIWNFAGFGVYRLALTPDRYGEVVRDLRNYKGAIQDADGVVCSIRRAGIDALLAGKDASAYEIATGRTVPVIASKLHPTARYRLARYRHVML